MTRKITPEQAAAIKASPERAKVLAARYGIAHKYVFDIRAGRVHNLPGPPDGEWRDVPGFSGGYRVSTDGRVWSVLNGRMLTPRTTSWGYQAVTMSRLGEGPRMHRVHRVVALTFIHNPDQKPEVNHIDGNKQNNAVANLEWVTKKENAAHAVAAGAYKRRKLRTYNKLVPDEPKPCVICGTVMVRRATRDHRSRETTTAFAKRQCCSKACVGRLRSIKAAGPARATPSHSKEER